MKSKTSFTKKMVQNHWCSCYFLNEKSNKKQFFHEIDEIEILSLFIIIPSIEN